MYQTALVILLQLVPLGRVPAPAGLPLLAIRSALLEWFRAAELSADRAATLVNRDPLVTSRTLMVLASGVSVLGARPRLVPPAGAGLRGVGVGVGSGLASAERAEPHPLVSGAPRRGADGSGGRASTTGSSAAIPDARPDDRPKEEAGKAYDHYREKFKKTFEDAGESFDKTIKP